MVLGRGVRLSRKTVSAIMIFLLILGMITLAFKIQIVRADGETIYINADGSINPSTAPISTADNVTYTLTADIRYPVYLGIVVEINDCIIDGNGHAVLGYSILDNYGLTLENLNNVTIKNINVQNFHWGIDLFNCTNCTINASEATENLVGIDTSTSSHNILVGNNVVENGFVGMEIGDYSNNNLVIGNNIEQNGFVGIPGNPPEGGIFIDSYSDSNMVLENNLTGNFDGLYLGGASNTNIYSNNFLNNIMQVYGGTLGRGSATLWNDSYPSGGNYWSDYTGIDVKSGPNQDQPGSDGIGDTPYVIDANNTDHYPLMQPWVPNENGTIYIRADGSIDPPTAPIYTADNVHYTLIGNINFASDGIVIERDNIFVDGAGCMIQGRHISESRGIYLNGRSNVTIRNVTINAFGYGIWLDSSSGSTIYENNIANNEEGIYLDSSSNTSLSENKITNNSVGFLLTFSSNNNISENKITNGILLDYSSNNFISENNITANSLYGIRLDSSSNNNISENRIEARDADGIYLSSSNYTSISGNTFTNGGLLVLYSYQNSVENNTVNGKPLVYLESISNITVDDAGQVVLVCCRSMRVKGLNLSKTDSGIELWNTNNSTIYENNMKNNSNGILLCSSSINRIYENNITDNNEGIYLDYSSYQNSIFHNNFVNNTLQAYSYNSAIWDNGYPSGGNYWNDYNGPDLNHDGIGDTSYVINANNRDNYPLMSPWMHITGDLNGDGKVGLDDLVFLANAYGSKVGDPNWNPSADIAPPYGIIGLTDLVTLAMHYGQHYP